MKGVFKKVMAGILALALVAGTATVADAAVSKGTDVSSGVKWSSYSIKTREDGGEWEDALIKAGQYYAIDVKESDTDLDAYMTYGENAKISTQTSSSFTMDVTSTGWSANWSPAGEVVQSNPWGVTATKVVNVERGRYYTISFKIKSTLQNEITETKERSDGTAYNVGTGKYNYLKHIHFKAYDDKDEDGAALTLSSLKATQGGKSVLETSKSLLTDFSSFVKLDSQNTADDGWVTVSASVLIPSDKADYQSNKKSATMGIKFAFGAFLKEYPDENNMSGTIEVKDFKVEAGDKAKTPAKVKGLKVTAKKKAMVVKYKKVKNVKGKNNYQIEYSLKKNFKNSKTKNNKTKTKMTVKKLKSGKKYYVRVRAYYKTSGSKIYGKYSSKKAGKIK